MRLKNSFVRIEKTKKIRYYEASLHPTIEAG